MDSQRNQSNQIDNIQNDNANVKSENSIAIELKNGEKEINSLTISEEGHNNCNEGLESTLTHALSQKKEMQNKFFVIKYETSNIIFAVANRDNIQEAYCTLQNDIIKNFQLQCGIKIGRDIILLQTVKDLNFEPKYFLKSIRNEQDFIEVSELLVGDATRRSYTFDVININTNKDDNKQNKDCNEENKDDNKENKDENKDDNKENKDNNKENKRIDKQILFKTLQDLNKAIEISSDKNMILTIGNTGAGKSTTICYLTGHKMRLNENEETGETYIDIDQKDKHAPVIGHDTYTSSTIFPSCYTCKRDGDMVFCDFAGFNDTRRKEISMCVSLSIEMMVRNSKSISGIIIVISSSELNTCRGRSFRELSIILNKMLKPNDYENYVLFVITKVEKGVTKQQMRNRLQKFLNTEENKLKEELKKTRNNTDYSDDSDENITAQECQASFQLLKSMLKNENSVQIIDVLDDGNCRSNIMNVLSSLSKIKIEQFKFNQTDEDHNTLNNVIFDECDEINKFFMKYCNLLEEYVTKEKQMIKKIETLQSLSKYLEKGETEESQEEISLQITQTQLKEDTETKLSLEQEINKLSQSIQNLNNKLNEVDNDELQCYWSDCYYHQDEGWLVALGAVFAGVAIGAGVTAATGGFGTGIYLSTILTVGGTTGSFCVAGKKLFGKKLHSFRYSGIPYEKIEVKEGSKVGKLFVTRDEKTEGKYESEYRNNISTFSYEIKVKVMVKKRNLPDNKKSIISWRQDIQEIETKIIAKQESLTTCQQKINEYLKTLENLKSKHTNTTQSKNFAKETIKQFEVEIKKLQQDKKDQEKKLPQYYSKFNMGYNDYLTIYMCAKKLKLQSCLVAEFVELFDRVLKNLKNFH